MWGGINVNLVNLLRSRLYRREISHHRRQWCRRWHDHFLRHPPDATEPFIEIISIMYARGAAGTGDEEEKGDTHDRGAMMQVVVRTMADAVSAQPTDRIDHCNRHTVALLVVTVTLSHHELSEDASVWRSS